MPQALVVTPRPPQHPLLCHGDAACQLLGCIYPQSRCHVDATPLPPAGSSPAAARAPSALPHAQMPAGRRAVPLLGPVCNHHIAQVFMGRLKATDTSTAAQLAASEMHLGCSHMSGMPVQCSMQLVLAPCTSTQAPGAATMPQRWLCGGPPRASAENRVGAVRPSTGRPQLATSHLLPGTPVSAGCSLRMPCIPPWSWNPTLLLGTEPLILRTV